MKQIVEQYNTQIEVAIAAIQKETGQLFIGYLIPLEYILAELIRATITQEARNIDDSDMSPVTVAFECIESLAQVSMSQERTRIETILVDLLADAMADIGDPCPKCGGATEVYWSRRNGSNVDILECTRCNWQKVL